MRRKKEKKEFFFLTIRSEKYKINCIPRENYTKGFNIKSILNTVNIHGK